MAKRKLSGLAQALILADSLGPEDQVTLADYLRAKIPARPKSTAVLGATRKSKEKKVSTSTEKETVGSTGGCVVPGCGETEHYYIHSPENPDGHMFKAGKTKAVGAQT